MSTVSGRPQRGEGGVRPMWTHVDRGEGGQKRDFFCGRHKWMAPFVNSVTSSQSLRFPVVTFSRPITFAHNIVCECRRSQRYMEIDRQTDIQKHTNTGKDTDRDKDSQKYIPTETRRLKVEALKNPGTEEQLNGEICGRLRRGTAEVVSSPEP